MDDTFMGASIRRSRAEFVDDARAGASDGFRSTARLPCPAPLEMDRQNQDASRGDSSVLERCREAALAEVARASWPAVLQTAVQELEKPMRLLDGLAGLPEDLVERAQVSHHIQKALRVVPEPLRSEWAQHRPPLGRAAPPAERRRAASAPGAPRRPQKRGSSSADASEKASRAAFSLLKRWARVMRPIAEEGRVGITIAELVHGEQPVVLPTGSVAAEIRRLVPAPAELRGGARWEAIEDLMAILDLEDMIGPAAAAPPPPPAEAAAGGAAQDWPSAVAALCRGVDRGRGPRCPRPASAGAGPAGGGALPGRAAQRAPPRGPASAGSPCRTRRPGSAALGAIGQENRKTFFGTYAKARPPPLKRGLSGTRTWTSTPSFSS
ncbi:unnamed protein product [Prorocentrum cordatum]|uniref:Uncharacterized protein n=1 Tax=Prorocentrum cordatum TaxID=2364126 RepID=A0ABN9TMJ8_9DINO|nr:unnamed protein product [Polarella glacialis]